MVLHSYVATIGAHVNVDISANAIVFLGTDFRVSQIPFYSVRPRIKYRQVVFREADVQFF